MEQKQPMDYVEELMEYESFEELLAAEYAKMSFLQKLGFHIQNHFKLGMIITFILGYLVGVYTDEPWILSLLHTLNIQ
jgi:hypothetical protein